MQNNEKPHFSTALLAFIYLFLGNISSHTFKFYYFFSKLNVQMSRLQKNKITFILK